jgi:hypothetical protein
MRDKKDEKNEFFTVSALQTFLKKAMIFMNPPLWGLQRIHVKVEVHRKK